MGSTGILAWINSETGMGLLRNLLLAAGGSLVTSGVVSQNGLNDAVGAAIVILGVILSAISSMQKKKAMAIVQAVNDHPSLAIIPADQTATGKPVVQIAMTQAAGGGLNVPNPLMHAQ